MRKFLLHFLNLVIAVAMVSCSGHDDDMDDNGNGGGGGGTTPETLTVITGTPTEITESSVKVPVEVKGKNILARGVCYSIAPDPTVDGSKTNEGTISGSITSTISNLASGTTYYVRGYATDSNGTVYGEEKQFETSEEPQPETGIKIATLPVKDITKNTAIGGGNVTTDGGYPLIKKGICWNTYGNPSLKDSITYSDVELGSYNCLLTKLYGYKTYYVRSFATNTKGTTYGQEEEFRTSKDLPTILTLELFDITDNSVKCGGKILNEGDESLISYGICWGTQSNPTANNGNYTTESTDNKEFFSSAINLIPETEYYIRSYATNSIGTAYGKDLSFKTEKSNLPYDFSELQIVNISSNSIQFMDFTYNPGKNDNIISKGICCSTQSSPNIQDIVIDSKETSFYTIQGLEKKTTYYARPYVTNTNGTGYGKEIIFTTSDVTNIPDGKFLEYCVNHFDSNQDGLITTNELSQITSLNISGLGIRNIEGISFFTSLEELDCSSNDIDNLDLTQNIELKILSCSNNQISQINITNCKKINYIDCSRNKLTSLYIQNNSELKTIICSDNKFTSLDLSNNQQLAQLTIDNNILTSLNLDSNNKLEKIDCSNNKLSSINIDNLILLQELNCGNNVLSSINTVNNEKLSTLYCNDNRLTNLDISQNRQLAILDYSNGKFISSPILDFPGECSGNMIPFLDISNNSNLSAIYCSNNKIHELNLSNCKNLTRLSCENNQLTILDLSSNSKLQELTCYNNKIEALDFTHNTQLGGAIIHNNNLANSIDVTMCNRNGFLITCMGNPNLQSVYMTRNQYQTMIMIYPDSKNFFDSHTTLYVDGYPIN